jgi:hypothetical protein
MRRVWRGRPGGCDGVAGVDRESQNDDSALCEWCGSLRLRLLGLRCRHLAMDESHQPLSLYGSLAGPSRLAVRDDGGTIR